MYRYNMTFEKYEVLIVEESLSRTHRTLWDCSVSTLRFRLNHLNKQSITNNFGTNFPLDIIKHLSSDLSHDLQGKYANCISVDNYLFDLWINKIKNTSNVSYHCLLRGIQLEHCSFILLFTQQILKKTIFSKEYLSYYHKDYVSHLFDLVDINSNKD